MKKTVFIIIFTLLFACLYFNSCSNDKDENNQSIFDLTKFAELGYNTTALNINDRVNVLDSFDIMYWCYGAYIFKGYDNGKVILDFSFKASKFALGDSVFSVWDVSYYGYPDTIHSAPLSAAVKIYNHKREPLNNRPVFAGTDSLYLDAVFHIKFDDDRIKDIKGQILYRDTLRIDEILCL